jgi:quercetin dioxygenase-like cupin family protein
VGREREAGSFELERGTPEAETVSLHVKRGTFTGFSEHQPVELLPGVTRQMLSCGERSMTVYITIAKGAEVPIHTHPHEQIGYLQSGRAMFTIGDQKRVLETLDGYSIPGNVAHGVVALEDCVFVDVFSPPREEYRQ